MTSDILLAHEPAIRLGVFAGVFALLAGLEAWLPRRGRAFARRRRWPANLGMVVVNTLVLRLAFPAAAVGVAIAMEGRGVGLVPWLGLAGVPALLLAVVLLDLGIYLQHVMFHAVPALWRLHRMHHADLDFDVTTGLRFHPVEILLSMVVKLAVVVALGAPAAAVLLFEVLLNATSMFNHANLRLPAWLDRPLRHLLVTPDMHRVHHSAVPRETNSNFGFSLALWDRLFGTYRAQPEAGHESMTIGIPQFRDPVELRLDRLLTQPLRDDDRVDAPGQREPDR
jgi:sterol desaturase/sphingolipid hydroxylase (fatty acid hydroxylase superfamily)